MANVQDVQAQIFEEINDPSNKIMLQVQKKQINRDEYLKEIETRCKKEGLNDEEAEDIVYLVDKSLWGFGILDDLISDPDISDIRLVSENCIRIKRNGKRMDAGIKFASKAEYERYIEFITNRNNTNVSIQNAAQVFTDKDSSKTDILRFSLVSDLCNTNGRPTLLIRKIPKVKKTFETLIKQEYCTPAQAEYLKKRWADGNGILVCGPNGSGKTTLVNALLESTPKDKSADIIQESEELFCDSHPEMIFRKVIPARNGSAIAYSLKDLARLALMESFDIIVVGEIKGDEAAELSYATYTGSQAMTTVHSNSAEEGYEKLIDYGLDAQPNRTREHFATIVHECAHLIDDKIISLCGHWSEKSEEFLNCFNSEKEGIDICFPNIKENYTEDCFVSETFARVSAVVLTLDIKRWPNYKKSISSEIPLTSESVINFYRELPKIYKQYSMEVRNKYIKDFDRKDDIRLTFQWTLFERELYLFYVYNSNKNSFIIAKRFPENNYELILGKVYIKNGHIYNSKNEDCIELLKEFYIQDIDKYRIELYYIWFFERIWYCQDN